MDCKQILIFTLVGVVLILAMLPDGTNCQQQRNRPKGKGQSQQNKVQQEPPSSYEKVSSASKKNGSLPFNARWGLRPRISNKFHYSIPAADYWTKHERPFVPLIEPDLTEDLIKF